jgi:diguanylate cyclase (GGDEF)-like protein
VLIFAITLALSVEGFADDAKHVLVIHSHHQGLAWTDQITQGIQSVFNPFSQEFRLHFEYLDSRRLAGDDYFQELAALYRYKTRNTPFDVIIASGNPALQFLRCNDIRPAPGTPVVFCGVDRLQSITPLAAWEYGVAAQLDHLATLNLMLALHPGCRRIVVLIDDSFTHDSAADELDKALSAVRQKVMVDVWSVQSPDTLTAKLVGLDDRQELIYILVSDLGDGGAADLPADMVRSITRWSPVAVYSSLDSALGKGIVGGMITSGFNQGEQAARMAMGLLSGQPVPHSASAPRSPNQYMFDGRALQRFQIKMSRLPADSQIIHPLPEFWLRHRIIFLSVVAVMALLNGVLLALLAVQKKKQRTLHQTHAELDIRFREKAAHLKLINQKLKKQSLIDDLTGLPNRRFVYQRFVEESKKAQRYGQPLAILLITLDGFKQLNDKHGYVLAERVLRDVGQAIKRNVRDIDLVGRYGGESFLVILPSTDQGRIAADRIRKTVQSLQWEQGDPKITLSGGLAQLDHHTPAELISVAEKRLDLAKAQGGNRIVAADADEVRHERQSP